MAKGGVRYKGQNNGIYGLTERKGRQGKMLAQYPLITFKRLPTFVAIRNIRNTLSHQKFIWAGWCYATHKIVSRWT